MLYEILNPSDPYTIEADDFKTACVAVCILGKGAYGLKGGPREMPIFLVCDADEWFRGAFAQTFEEALRSIPHDALADCLDSVLCCVPAEYAEERRALSLVCATQGKAAFYLLRLEKHAARRSSMNDIGPRAWALAERVKHG